MKSVTVVRLPLNKLTKSNGQTFSTSLRIEGDVLAEDGKLFDALELYNKSLCYAQLNSHDISSAYECRSVVYLKAKEYQLCLKNIELARNYCDDITRLAFLSKLEKECKELMIYDYRKVEDEPWNFFKLSHQQNDKIPFIADCLKLHNSETFGRLIITNEG